MGKEKKMNTLSKRKRYLVKCVGISIFSAFAFVVALVCNVIPPIQGFLSLDLKDAVISIAAIIYGPISSVIISFIAAFIEFLTFSTTGWYGFIMNFMSSAVFSATVSLVYKYQRTLNGALVGFLGSVIATTGVMLVLNRFVTPVYLCEFVGMSRDGAAAMVLSLLPRVLLPFNLSKSLLNAAIAMMLYKPVLAALSKAKLLDRRVGLNFNKNSMVIVAIGALALAVSVMVLIFIS